jgi:hypothetical protein
MPVTLAIPFRDAKKRPPPLPVTPDADASSAPPPLPSMRVPKGIIVHDARGEEIDVHAAVLKARRATEELEWQAQVKRAKESLRDVAAPAPVPAQSDEAVEWEALRARMKSVQVEAAPNAQQVKRPAPKLAVVPPPAAAAPSAKTVPEAKRVELAAVPTAAADEEREWQELRARARLNEEREWQELIARARVSGAIPAHPFDAQPVQRARPPRAQPRIVAWP